MSHAIYKFSAVAINGVAALILLACSFVKVSAENPVRNLSLDMTRTDLNIHESKRVVAVTALTTDFTGPEKFEAMQGGAGTSRKFVNRNAFSNSAENLTFAQERDFKLGNALFRKFWVAAPASTKASDGLGPLYNARSCQSCHLKDGRGRPPEVGEAATSMFLRLARQPQSDEQRQILKRNHLTNLPDPIYGRQLQNFAVAGVAAEGHMEITYQYRTVTMNGGERAELRRPNYAVKSLNYGPLALDTTLSPRVAPAMIGLGLIEQIHPADLARKSDPHDQDKDGISGRLQWVPDPITGQMDIGRFGWKAENSSVLLQSAGALVGDIGVSNPFFPASYGDCTTSQISCRNAPDGMQPSLGVTEAPDPVLALITFYARNLAVPRRRNVEDPKVLEGKKLFYKIGCVGCHAPKYVTRRDAPTKAHQFQLIWPYSDFLLHDMGEGLADGQQVAQASGREWRTPALWGIGLTETVSGHTFFLHDGRARNMTEAILWHGGEAEKSKQSFAALTSKERQALISFLESL